MRRSGSVPEGRTSTQAPSSSQYFRPSSVSTRATHRDPSRSGGSASSRATSRRPRAGGGGVARGGYPRAPRLGFQPPDEVIEARARGDDRLQHEERAQEAIPLGQVVAEPHAP